MKYWDSSALVALHVEQVSTVALRDLLAADPVVVVWTLSDVEIRSALARLSSEGALRISDMRTATAKVEGFWMGVHVVSAVDAVKARAKRLLGTHSLKAADALQLAAALTSVRHNPAGREFVCLAQRLADAAGRGGFTVLP